MPAKDCYTHTAEAAEGSAKVTFSRNAGNNTGELIAEEPVLEQTGTLAGKYRLDLWAGSDKTKSSVLEGSGFALSVSLGDGSAISARGSNAFPDRLWDVKTGIMDVFSGCIPQDM